MVAVVHRSGTVGELHALDPFSDPSTEPSTGPSTGRVVGPSIDGGPAAPRIWICEPTDVALVLGSRQGPDLVDREACERAGVSVASRRSGGGAVLVDPARVVWVDAIVPHGVAPDDVRGSMIWFGERAVVALAVAGHVGESVTVHRAGMACGPGSDIVCFAGIGPGEVLDGGRKLVGLSQRRTRHGIRIQAMVHTAPLQHELAGLVTVDVPELDPIGVAADLDGRTFAAALATLL